MPAVRYGCMLGLAVALFATAPLPAQELSKEEKDAGFVSLFNGKSLDGWMGAKEAWFVEDDGTFFCRKLVDGTGKLKPQFRTLRTTGEYANFVLRLDYLLQEGVSNGIGLRTDAKKEVGVFKVQLLDDHHSQQRSGEDFKKTGSLAGLVGAKQGVQKPAEQWNTMEIIAKGLRIQVIINGQQVVDTDKTPLPKTLDRGQFRPKGHIAVLGHTGRAEFKNIRIKELK